MAVTLRLSVADGANVQGVVNLTATADSPMSKVRFYLDGVQASEDVGFPWTWAWDTRLGTDAAHTVEVKAIRHGRVTAKRSITVTVDNGTGPGAPSTVTLTGTLTGTGSLTGTPTVATGGGILSVYWGARIRQQFYQDRQSTYGTLPAYVDVPLTGSNQPGGVWDLFELHAGKRVTCVHTGTGGNSWPLPAYQTSQANNARARGAFLNYTLGTTPTGLQNIIAMNASAISVLTTFFTQIRNHGHPILFRPFWEMNGSWYAWGNPGGSGGSLINDAQYVKLWQNLWQACADVMSGSGTAGSNTGTHTGNVSFFWCPNVIDVADPSGRYPGAAYVDWLGFDGYAANTTYQSPATRFNSTYALLETLDATKPFFIGETGCNPDIATPFKSGWITDFLGTWLPAHPRVKGFSWFNEYGSPNLPHIEVGNGATTLGGAAQSAFATEIADSYYKANIVTSALFPSGSKIPVPAGSTPSTPGGLNNSAEGGTPTNTVTTGNSGGGSGDAWSKVEGPGASGTIQYSNSRVLSPSTVSYRMATRGTTEAEYLQWENATDVAEAYGREYFLFSDIPVAANCKVLTVRVSDGSTNLAHVSMSTAGKLNVRNGSDSILYTSTATLVIEQWYRLEWHYVAAGAASTMEARIYEDHDTTLLEGSGIKTTGGSSSLFKVVRHGITFTGQNQPSATSHLYLDDINAFADGWPGPSA